MCATESTNKFVSMLPETQIFVKTLNALCVAGILFLSENCFFISHLKNNFVKFVVPEVTVLHPPHPPTVCIFAIKISFKT